MASDWEKLYQGLVARNEFLERENLALHARLVLADVQGKTWELDKMNQQVIIQQEFTKLNERHQEQSMVVVQLRQRIRELGGASDDIG